MPSSPTARSWPSAIQVISPAATGGVNAQVAGAGAVDVVVGAALELVDAGVVSGSSASGVVAGSVDGATLFGVEATELGVVGDDSSAVELLHAPVTIEAAAIHHHIVRRVDTHAR